jgi:oligoribonuclease (3'-5' exoribonuclease)
MLFLDIETTGLDYTKHQILSLGMLHIDEHGNKKEFIENCSYKEYTVTSEALNVNGINLATHLGLSTEELQEQAIKFLLETEHAKKYMEVWSAQSYHPFSPDIASLAKYTRDVIQNDKKIKILPIGFNIGTFDMMFIKKHLPEFNKFFSYRAIDLNSLIYLEAQIKETTYEELKRYYSKKFEVNHNALDDCRKAYDVYQEIVNNLTPVLHY